MRRTGTATAPLHGGHCPPWLFAQMTHLSASIVEAIAVQHGTGEVLARLADPVWLQSFGSVLGFDWHSSGLTTVVLGALKEGLAGREADVGVFVCGGKGKVSRKTPQEIEEAGARHALALDAATLVHASRMSAKVDSNVVQDGYDLYHHVFAFDREGAWAVVQQGMDPARGLARRYHWRSDQVASFVVEPHAAVAGVPERVLDLSARANGSLQAASLTFAHEPDAVLDTLRAVRDGKTLTRLTMPVPHAVPSAARLNTVLYALYDAPPSSYEDLVGRAGVGKSTLRALAMTAEIVAGAAPTFTDPVRYSFAHGGKDGHPFPVQRSDYAQTLALLEDALQKARLGELDRLKAFERLARLSQAGKELPAASPKDVRN